MSVQIRYSKILGPVSNFKRYYQFGFSHPDFERILASFNCQHIVDYDTDDNIYQFNTEEDLTFFILRWS
jgi:hypothetical protein